MCASCPYSVKLPILNLLLNAPLVFSFHKNFCVLINLFAGQE